MDTELCYILIATSKRVAEPWIIAIVMKEPTKQDLIQLTIWEQADKITVIKYDIDEIKDIEPLVEHSVYIYN